MLALLVSASPACLGGQAEPAVPDAGMLRPVSQPVRVQAATNDTTFFLHVRWSSSSLAPGLAVALSDREPATRVRDFAIAGCFLACHDRATDMPNWLPEDGNRPMFLLPSFGGSADVWDWRSQPEVPAGQVVDSVLDTAGLRPDPDGGPDNLSAVGSIADQTWDVVYARPLSATGPGDVTLAPGGTYDLALALHPDGIAGRNHYVSLPIAVALGDAVASLTAVPVPGASVPDFSDGASFPPLAVDLFLPGITSFEFLVGAVVDRNGQLRRNDELHGGAHAVATGSHACSDCHRVVSDAVLPPIQNAGALERLVLRRGGVFGPAAIAAGIDAGIEGAP